MSRDLDAALDIDCTWTDVLDELRALARDLARPRTDPKETTP
ncbi:hypothetical protein BH11ACT1_BH11ACT1_19270 [soil metagenome]